MDDALLSRAFPVENLPDDFDPTVPPSTGEEYLQHVMYEASKCEQIVVANVDRSRYKNSVSLKLTKNDKCNEGSELAPCLEWQQYQVAQFSELRQRVNRLRKSNSFKPVKLPNANEEEKWYKMFFGDDNTRLPPHLSILLSMNESTLGRVLEYHVDYLEDGFKSDQGRWIYAILACISFPLTADVCSVLRDLARTCAKLRCKKTSSEDPEVISLNLIISLVRIYFGKLHIRENLKSFASISKECSHLYGNICLQGPKHRRQAYMKDILKEGQPCNANNGKPGVFWICKNVIR